MAGWLSRDLILGGRRIAVRERGLPGQGTLLLLHGLGMHQRSWDRVAKALDGFHLVTFDYAGHGRSDPADEYSVAGLLHDLGAVIAKLAIDAYIMVGHSIGADLSLLHASSSDACRGLVLVDGALTASPPPADWERLSILQDRFLFRAMTWIGRRVGAAAALSIHEIRLLTEDLEKTRSEFERFLARLVIPVLYVIGDQADRVPDGEVIHERKMSSISDIAARHPVRVEYVSCGHLVPLRQPQQLGQLIRGFSASLLT